MIEEKFISSKSAELSYMFQEGKQDSKGLIVIFSGYGLKSLYTYDFAGKSLSNCKSNILWIKDDIGGFPSYYQNIPTIDAECAIDELIGKFKKKYNVKNNEVLFLGASKGGFGALYHALRLGIRYVIASAPTVELGKSLSLNETKKEIFRHITGFPFSNDGKAVVRMNAILYDLIREAKSECNIYLFNSPNDEIESGEKLFQICSKSKYIHCDRIIINSKLVYQHNVVTRYFSTFIASLCNIFSYTLTLPSFGKIIYLENEEDRNHLIQHKVESELTEVEVVDGGGVSFKGYAFIKGKDSSCYGSFDKKLIFRSDSHQFIFDVGSIKNKDLSSKFYEGYYVDYLTGGFATFERKPIPIRDLPFGDYYIEVNVNEIKSNENISSPVNFKKANIILDVGAGLVVITNINGSAVLRYVNYVSEYKPTLFELKKCALNSKGELEIEGRAIVRSLECQNWGDFRPFLILKSKLSSGITKCFALGQRSDLRNINYLGEVGDYLRSSFSNKQNELLKLSSLPEDDYFIIFTCFIKSFIFSKNVGELRVSRNGCSLDLSK